jgi:hypothetical protein
MFNWGIYHMQVVTIADGIFTEVLHNRMYTKLLLIYIFFEIFAAVVRLADVRL